MTNKKVENFTIFDNSEEAIIAAEILELFGFNTKISSRYNKDYDVQT